MDDNTSRDRDAGAVAGRRAGRWRGWRRHDSRQRSLTRRAQARIGDLMSARNLNRRGLVSWLVVGCASAVWLAGCGSSGGGSGPDVKVSPSYQPSGRLTNVAGNKQAVAVAVVDARTSKGQAQGGREILAQGDKGRVYTE